MLTAEESKTEEIERRSFIEIGHAPFGDVWGNANPFGLGRATVPFVTGINSLSPQVGQRKATTTKVPTITGGTFSSIPVQAIPPDFEFLRGTLNVYQDFCRNLGDLEIVTVESHASPSLLKLLTDVPLAESETRSLFTVGISRTIPETMTQEAENYGRSSGLFGSLVVAKAIVKETLGKLLSAIHIDRMEDPEDPRHVTLYLQLSVSGSVDEIYELDKTVQKNLMEKIPNGDFPFIGVLYQFE